MERLLRSGRGQTVVLIALDQASSLSQTLPYSRSKVGCILSFRTALAKWQNSLRQYG
jgi:hypothetical protein